MGSAQWPQLPDLRLPHIPGAACRNTPDPDIFVPSDGKRVSAKPAKAICRTCPTCAWVKCLVYGTRVGADGVWAGTTKQERERLAAWNKEAGSAT
jgi:Transcription factor WhiB